MIDVVRILRETFVVRAEHFPSLDSTNNRAAQRAAQGVKELPLLIVADEQTAGRGRGANRWWTGAGGLAFSLLVDAATAKEKKVSGTDFNGKRFLTPFSSLAALAAAVAVVETVSPLAADNPVKIRWPNDVLAGERKICGILVEVLADRRHIIGVGLNTNNTLADAPVELRDRAATLRDLVGRPVDQTAVLIGLLKRLESEFTRLRDTPAAVAQRANALCLQRDRPVTMELGGRRTSGICRGIAPDGALLLETPAGIERFISGTIQAE